MTPPPAKEPGAGERYHGLDGLRASMMLLGVVLHSACSFQASPPDAGWPYRDAESSQIFGLLVAFIHVWRMPIFMFLAGYFAALLVERRGATSFLRNRLRRIVLPLLIFLPILLPPTVLGFQFAGISRLLGNAAGWEVVEGVLRNRDGARLETLFPPQTIHLWFLSYLTLYSGIAYLALTVLDRPLRRIRPALWGSLILSTPAAGLLVVLPLAWILRDSYGAIPTGSGLVPEGSSLLAYGWLYFCGWCARRGRSFIHRQASWPRIALSLGGLGPLFLLWVGWLGFGEAGESGRSPVLATLASGLMILTALGGFTGLFLKLVPREVRWVRYLTDASYWIYLAHLPLTIWIPGLLAESGLGVAGKFAVTLGGTLLATLLSYDLFVRSTPIGRLLNGRTFPRVLSPARLRGRPPG